MLELYAILMAEDFKGFKEVDDYIVAVQKDKMFEVSDYIKKLIREYIAKNAENVLSRLERTEKSEDSQQFLMYTIEALIVNREYDVQMQALRNKFFYS